MIEPLDGESVSPKIVVIGASAGGLAAISRLWQEIAGKVSCPVAAVQHLAPGGDLFLAQRLNRFGPAVVASNRCRLLPGRMHVAPAGYHMLVEDPCCLVLSVDPPVHFCRPAIDPLFESAARVFGASVIGVVLTGANEDGAAGAARIVREGGTVMVQDPTEAEVATMPLAALAAAKKSIVGTISALAAGIIERMGDVDTRIAT